MTRLTKVTCLMAVLLLPTILEGQSPQSSDVPGNRALRENLAAAVAWDAAFNSENVDAVMAQYADGAVSMPPGFLPLEGKPAIRADYEFLFANFDFHHQTTVVQLEIQGSLAVERGEYTMTIVPADGSGAFVETGKHLIVRRMIEGSWRVIEETWNTH